MRVAAATGTNAAAKAPVRGLGEDGSEIWGKGVVGWLITFSVWFLAL